MGPITSQPVHIVDLVSDASGGATTMLAATQAISAQPGLVHIPLDHAGLPACGDACTEELLKVRTILSMVRRGGWRCLST